MKTKLILKTILAGMFIFLFVNIHSAFADQEGNTSITLSPATIKTDVDPGSNYSSVFKVKNSGIDAYDFEVSVAPYSVSGEEYETQFTESNERTAIKDWVKFTDGTTFHAEPGEEVEVKFTIDVPKDAVGGGQYAVVFAKTVPSNSTNTTGVTIAKRVGGLLFAKVSGDTFTKGNIFDQTIPSWVWDNSITTTFRASNEGNVDNSVQYSVKVSGLFGKVFESDPNYSRLVFPNTTRHLFQNADNINIPGIYKVEQNVKYLENNSNINKYVVVCPVWALILLISIIFLLIIVIWFAKTNKSRKVKRMAKKLKEEQLLKDEAQKLLDEN